MQSEPRLRHNFDNKFDLDLFKLFDILNNKSLYHPGCLLKKVQEKFRLLGLRKEDQACYQEGNQTAVVSKKLPQFQNAQNPSNAGFTGR